MDMVIEKGDSTLPGELPASSAASMRGDHMTLELSYVIILVITRHLRQNTLNSISLICYPCMVSYNKS